MKTHLTSPKGITITAHWRRVLATVTFAIAFYCLVLSFFKDSRHAAIGAEETTTLHDPTESTSNVANTPPLEETPAAPPRILYVNTHPGTQSNFAHIFARLGLAFSSYDPSPFGFAMSQEKAQELIDSGLAKELCDSADVIVISDTCAHGRFILQTLIDPDPAVRCTAKIVLELTNRFDWGYNDPQEREAFRAFMWRVATEHFHQVTFTANNPLESRQLADFAIATPHFRILRPVGWSDVLARVVDEDDAKLPLIRTKEDSPILKQLDAMHVQYKHVVQGVHSPYGGPKTAAKHKAFVEFPYQASTMKLYENAAAGVVMLVPSPQFYFELKKGNFFSTPDIQTHLLYQGKNWQRYHDYYSNDMKQFLYYFDSFDELARLLNSTTVDVRNIRETGPAKFAWFANQTVFGWADILIELGFPFMKVDGLRYAHGKGPRPYRESLRSGVKEVVNLDQWKASYKASRKQLEAADEIEWDAIDVKVVSLAARGARSVD